MRTREGEADLRVTRGELRRDGFRREEVGVLPEDRIRATLRALGAPD